MSEISNAIDRLVKDRNILLKDRNALSSRQREAVKVLEEANAAASKFDHEGRSNWDYNSMRVYQEAVDKALAILKGE